MSIGRNKLLIKSSIFYKSLIRFYILLTSAHTLSVIFIGRNKLLVKSFTRAWSAHTFSSHYLIHFLLSSLGETNYNKMFYFLFLFFSSCTEVKIRADKCWDWVKCIFFQTIGNILAIPKGNGTNDEGYDLQLIDFEYSAYNYRWETPLSVGSEPISPPPPHPPPFLCGSNSRAYGPHSVTSCISQIICSLNFIS